MLSIIIPTLNEEKCLPLLLEEIKSQEDIDCEIIVADNSSRDNTRKIAVSYGARVVEGGLPAKARNSGALAAKGETLLFLDADVALPAPDFLKKTLEEFNSRKLEIAACPVSPASERRVDKLFHYAYNAYLETSRFFAARATGSCLYAKKSVHQKIKGFDEEILLGEDHDYARRAGEIAKFGILRSYPIIVSVRRLDRDGRLNVAVKYILCEAHSFLKGPVKSDIFKYNFGYENFERKSLILEAKEIIGLIIKR